MKYNIIDATSNRWVSRDVWGEKNGKYVYLYSITNTCGTTLQVTNYGAAIVSCKLSDELDVVVGDKSFKNFTNGKHPHFGATTGRLAGRTSTAPFFWPRSDLWLNSGKKEQCKQYQLKGNERPETHLHGGEVAFGRRVWGSGRIFETSTDLLGTGGLVGVDFLLSSPNLEGGYPGNVEVLARIGLNKNKNTIHISYEVTSDTSAPVNLTNHTYFNLGTKDVLQDSLTIDVDQVCVYDNCAQVVGLQDIPHTPFDFRKEVVLDSVMGRIKQEDMSERGGLDHIFTLSTPTNNQPKYEELKNVAIYKAANGNIMNVWSTASALVCYAGNYLSKYTDGDRTYNQHEAICLETQHLPGFLHNMEIPLSYAQHSQPWESFTEYEFIID